MAATRTSASVASSATSDNGTNSEPDLSPSEDTADTADTADVTRVDLHETVLKSCGLLTGKDKTEWYSQRVDVVQAFALCDAQFGDSLKRKAQALGFIITISGRPGTRDGRRIYCGIPTKARKLIQEQTLSGKVPRSLFRFNQHRDGLFHASAGNSDVIEDYLRYREIYRRNLNTGDLGTPVARSADSDLARCRRPAKIWSAEDTKTLVAMRCTDNPSTFRQIALALNRTHEVVGSIIDRRFEALDCRNKWSRMFPSAMDCNKTLEYVKALQKKWPNLVFKTTTEKCRDTRRPPRLFALHVVWPWAAALMSALSPSIFCDATYKVTLYHYKVVMITTLDGDKHHRPLMVSFITTSDKKTWREIFNLFAR